MYKVSLTLLVGCLLLHFVGFSQPIPGVSWMHKQGGSKADRFRHVSILNNGTLVCSGVTLSTNGDGVGNKGGADFFLQCFDQRGKMLWKKVFGGSDDDGGSYSGNRELTVPTQDGGFYFAGSTPSKDGDIPGNKGYADAFIVKFDSIGNIIWKKTYGGDWNEFVSGVVATPDGGCIISALTLSNNFGDVPATRGSSDIWIFKLDASGAIQWSKTYGGTNAETATCLQATNDGNYIFAANTTSTNGDLASLPAHGSTDAWIVKINPSGDILWQKRFGGSNVDEATVVYVSGNNYYIGCNSFSADGDFPENGDLCDIHLLKLSSTGDLVWRNHFNARGGQDYIEAITQTADGNIVYTGSVYSGTFDGIYKGLKGECDVLICKVDSGTGQTVWHTEFGGRARDFGGDVVCTKNNELIVVGETASSDYDLPDGLGDYDAFVMKLSAFNGISGYVYFDNNGNNIKDNNEPYVENVHVASYKKDSYNIASFTGPDGFYNNDLDSGSFVTKVRLLNPQYFTVTPDSFVNTFNTYYQSVTTNFAVKPVANKQDLRTVLVAIDPARPGFDCRYKLIGYNVGTKDIASGTISFIKDPRVTFLSALPVEASVVGDTVRWSFSNLKSLDSIAIEITCKIGRPPFVTTRDWLHYQSTVDPVAGDLQPGDNKFTLFHMVTGSFDPNDKSEAHGGKFSTANLANKDFLYYTIRFQNTGTDTAFTVVVKDTLDENLDWNSIDMVSASHSCRLSVQQGKFCTWTFNKINLPDSNINEPKSHGYICYRIRPKANLQINDTIKNAAAIYFDYNLPVQTNTQFTIITPPLQNPVVSGLASNYCSNAGANKIKIANLPASSENIKVIVKLDNSTELAVETDSTFSVKTDTLKVGSHKIDVNYTDFENVKSYSYVFTIKPSSRPTVKVSVNTAHIVSASQQVIITATNAAGGGTYPLFAFSKNRNMTDLLQDEGTNKTATLNASSLLTGDNWIYVRMKTSDDCYDYLTSMDSVKITKDAEPANSPVNLIVVYPNPVKRNSNIKVAGLSSGKIYKIILYNNKGNVIANVSVQNKKEAEISLPTYTTGIYLLSVYDADSNHLLKTIRVLRE
ncbi:T9SS type A sorting domain-containing protein [Chitinophagaceae bacterium 26-R-25]|nr:T9SS type A sorting domain-containing protein [Chitinophagaceae bacterium 26-R-25]